MPPVPTRGQRHLRQFLEENGGPGAKAAARSKTATDVVPVLQEGSGGRVGSDRKRTGGGTGDVGFTMQRSALDYLADHASTGATNKMSRRQMKLVQALSESGKAGEQRQQRHEGSPPSLPTFRVKRACLPHAASITDTIALAAVQRRASSGDDLVESSLFVLTDNEKAARQLQEDLEKRYGVAVLLLADGSERHPTFPLEPRRGRSTRSPPPPASTTAAKKQRGKSASANSKTKKGRRPVEEREGENGPEGAHREEGLLCAVVVATPEGFLAVDKRSAIWKFIGAYVVALLADSSKSAGAVAAAAAAAGSLVHKLSSAAGAADEGKEGAQAFMALRLSAQRCDCLGHTSCAVVLSLSEEALTAPVLDWCLTLRPTEEAMRGVTGKDSASSAVPAVVAIQQPQQRHEVPVYYAVAEGIHRFGFLFTLVKNLSAHTGLVVHVATKEACAFLYNVLYTFLSDLPRHVQLLTDYEGEGEFTSSVSSVEDRYRLCQEFNDIVKPKGTARRSGRQHTAAVLLSCYGLVPTKGDVFLSYDVIPDVVNFGQFVANVLTPGAYLANAGEQAEVPRTPSVAEEERGRGVAQRDVTVRKRGGRSVSPPPRPRKAAKTADSQVVVVTADLDGEGAEEDGMAAATPAMYSHVILLLRPNEVKGALRRLQQHQARFQLRYAPLPQKPALSSYLLCAEALKEMHKKVFVIANGAYHAYRATMVAYCTIGPRDVYNEKDVNLEKVSEEFGFTELPLLDLRLKDTAFRPKEDLYKAAKAKQVAERRAYKKFVDANIVGEGPEEHIVEQQQ